MDVNKVWLMGTVFRDPKSFAEGKVASFTLATSETIQTKDGSKRYENEYHNCAAFGALATKVLAEVTDRSRVAVEGKITQEKKEKPDGTQVTYHGIKVSHLQVFPAVDIPEETSAVKPRRKPSAQPKAQTLEEAEAKIAARKTTTVPQDDISLESIPF